jgi:CRP/FNR family transcriptional regulator
MSALSATGFHALPCGQCAARASTLCASLPDADMYRLYGLAVEQDYAPGALVCREEDAADYVFSLRSGYATVFRLTAEGKRQILAFLFPGDFIGMTSEDTFHFSVTATTPVRCCRFERTALEALIAQFPVMDRKLRFTFERAMDAAWELIFSLGRKNAVQKVAAFLWFVSYRQRKLGRPENPVHLPMRRADIADFMGLTIETVSRAFTQLRGRGIIRTPSAEDVEIVDMARLRAIGVVVAEPAPFRHADPEHYPRKPPAR